MSKCLVLARSESYSESLVDQLLNEGIPADATQLDANTLSVRSSNPELRLLILDVDSFRDQDLTPVTTVIAELRPDLQLLTLATSASDIPEAVRNLSKGVLKKPIPMKELTRIVKSHIQAA